METHMESESNLTRSIHAILERVPSQHRPAQRDKGTEANVGKHVGIHGLALRRCLRQLSSVHRVVPGCSRVWAELDDLARQYGDTGTPEDRDDWAQDALRDKPEDHEGGDALVRNGRHDDESETDRESEYGEEEDEGSSEDDSKVDSESPLKQRGQKALDVLQGLASHSPMDVIKRQDSDSPQLVKMAFPARAFLDQIGGQCIGTVLTKQRQEALKTLSKFRHQPHGGDSSGGTTPHMHSDPNSPAGKHTLMHLDKTLRNVANQQDIVKLLGMGLASMEAKMSSAISRIIRALKEQKIARWGDLTSDQTKVLQNKVRSGLALVLDLDAVVPKLVQYVANIGTDWDDLIMELSLNKSNMHLWAAQEELKSAALAETHDSADLKGRSSPGRHLSDISPNSPSDLFDAQPQTRRDAAKGIKSPLLHSGLGVGNKLAGGDPQFSSSAKELYRAESTGGPLEGFSMFANEYQGARRNSTETMNVSFEGRQHPQTGGSKTLKDAVRGILSMRQTASQKLISVSNELQEMETLGAIQQAKRLKRIRMTKAIKESYRTGELRSLVDDFTRQSDSKQKKKFSSSSFVNSKGVSFGSGHRAGGGSQHSFISRGKAAIHQGGHSKSAYSKTLSFLQVSISGDDS